MPGGHLAGSIHARLAEDLTLGRAAGGPDSLPASGDRRMGGTVATRVVGEEVDDDRGAEGGLLLEQEVRSPRDDGQLGFRERTVEVERVLQGRYIVVGGHHERHTVVQRLERSN